MSAGREATARACGVSVPCPFPLPFPFLPFFPPPFISIEPSRKTRDKERLSASLPLSIGRSGENGDEVAHKLAEKQKQPERQQALRHF